MTRLRHFMADLVEMAQDVVDINRCFARTYPKGKRFFIVFDNLLKGMHLSYILRDVLDKGKGLNHELDEELKPCFLHMSFFKENAIIRQEKLEQIWDATGLNIGIHFTNRLVHQSIIESVNEPLSFYELRLNPLLHMLAIKKAEEEMGLEIFKSNGDSRPSQNPCHRIIQCGREKFNHSTNQDKRCLISLIFHGGGGDLDDVSPSYWKSFELLKILDMEDLGAKTLPETIGILTELRYLGLRNNYIQEIPHSLAHLENIEVLDIALNFMVEVPNIIWKMRSLRKLHLADVICRKPLKLDALQDLETLTYISIYDWEYEVSSFEMMTRLQKLGIEEVDEDIDVGVLFASLAKLQSLDHLILRGSRFKSMPCLNKIRVLYMLMTLCLDGRLTRLPSTLNFPPYMYSLVLVNTCLDEDPMPVLEHFPSLRHLKLRNAYIGREMVIQRNGFPRLDVLHIKELWNLRKVRVAEGAMSRGLKELEIKNCPQLETLPTEIGSAVHLKKFKMVTTKHIATRIRNSGLTSKILEEDIQP